MGSGLLQPPLVLAGILAPHADYRYQITPAKMLEGYLCRRRCFRCGCRNSSIINAKGYILKFSTPL